MGAQRSRSNKMTRSGPTSNNSKHGSRASLPTATSLTGSAGLNRPKTPTLEPAPDRDPFGTYERRLATIAKRTGMPLSDLMDIWDEMAASRTYLGMYSPEDSNELAFQDVEKMFAPQGEMFDEEAA